MKKSFLLCLALAFLLSACLPPKIIHHEAFDLKVDFTPFENAGCPLDEYGYNRICAKDSALYALGCDRLAEVPAEFGGLEPAYPIATCTYVPYWREDVGDPFGTPENEYFFNVGGPMPMLVRYVIFVDGEYRLIRNPDEFRAVYAPVNSSEEALSFALALADVYTLYGQTYSPLYRYEVRSLEDTYVQSTGDGYLVHAFDYQFFGCGPHYYYAVDLMVNPDGKVGETSREKIYRDPGFDGLCQD